MAVVIEDVSLEPKDEIHRRKLEALEDFIERLLRSPVRDSIAKMVLHGSVLDGEAEEESDIDLLVFGTKDLKTLGDVCSDLSFETLLETGELVEPMVFGLSEFLIPHSYFILTALRRGKEVYSMDEKEMLRDAVEGYHLLATEYLEGAEKSLAMGHLRVAIDTAHNAAELCAKGFLIGKVEKMPARHGAVVNLFSDLYVKTGILPAKLGRGLRRALEFRNMARYEYEAKITPSMAEETIELAKELLDRLREYILEEWR